MSAVFYLGSPEPGWLARAGVPLFVSRNRFERRPSRPIAAAPWALDSGGFTELDRFGGWTVSVARYARFVREVEQSCGSLVFAAPQDWMCEPFMVARTGLDVREHVRRTVDNFVELRSVLGWVVIPVLQGYGPRDYERCLDEYARAGVQLSAERLVGVGSVCRRSGSAEASRLLRVLADYGLRLHAFGVKGSTWRACRGFLASADSMAWSYAARKQGRNGNSLAEALRWRAALLSVSDGRRDGLRRSRETEFNHA